MEKQAKYREHIENLKKFAQSQAKFKQLVQQARRGQVTAAETAATILKPVTEALLGKQPETKPLSEEELKNLKEKGLLGLVKEQQEAAAGRVIERSDAEKRKLAEALVANIVDPNARQAELDRLINNPLELEQTLATLTTQEVKNILENLSGEIKDIKEEQKRVGKFTVGFMEVGDQRNFFRKQANNSINDDEYKEFLEKKNIENLDNIKNWEKEKFDTLRYTLRKITEEGHNADKELDKTMKTKEMFPLLDRIRQGIIAYTILITAIDGREKGYGKGWGFKRKFKLFDDNRVEEYREEEYKKKTGEGVRIFASVTEMIGRLMLLISSKEAGNVGAEIDNEIVDILDNLRSRNLLASDEYETLHRDLIL